MKALALLLLLLASPAPALAQDPNHDQNLGPALTARQFDAYVTGKTLHWSMADVPWGTEEYLPGGQVQWATTPGECEIGVWYEAAGAICFRYEGRDDPACWIFRQGEAGLTADLQGPSGPLLLSESAQSDEGLPCPGPEVGV